MLEKSISLCGVKNARQLGGYRIGDKRIRDGILIRTAALNQAAPEALEALRDNYRVQMIIDFRMSQEQNHLPDPAIPGAKNIHLPVIEMEDMLADVDPKLMEQFSDSQLDRMAMFNMAYETGALNDKLYTDFLLKDRGRAALR